jgi:hypothetical protein
VGWEAARAAAALNRERKAQGLPPLPPKSKSRSRTRTRSAPARVSSAPAADATIRIAPPPADAAPSSTSSRGPDFAFIIDSAAAMTGLICFMGGIDTDYAPTHQEIDAILTPLLRILNRRVSVLSKLGPDAEDAALAMIGVIGYVTRLVGVAAGKRAIERSRAGGLASANGHSQIRTPASPGQTPGNSDHITSLYSSILARTADPGPGND